MWYEVLLLHACRELLGEQAGVSFCQDGSHLPCVVCRLLFNTWVRERKAWLKKEAANDHQGGSVSIKDKVSSLYSQMSNFTFEVC